MKPLKQVAGYNLLAVLLYSILIHFGSGRAAMGIVVYSAFVVGAHVVISIVISLSYFASKNKEWGRAWLLSTGIVLLVGFSTCLGNASLGTTYNFHQAPSAGPPTSQTASLQTHTPSSPPPSLA